MARQGKAVLIQPAGPLLELLVALSPPPLSSCSANPRVLGTTKAAYWSLRSSINPRVSRASAMFTKPLRSTVSEARRSGTLRMRLPRLPGGKTCPDEVITLPNHSERQPLPCPPQAPIFGGEVLQPAAGAEKIWETTIFL